MNQDNNRVTIPANNNIEEFRNFLQDLRQKYGETTEGQAGFKGFINHHSNCYMNGVLICLFSHQGFCAELENPQNIPENKLLLNVFLSLMRSFYDDSNKDALQMVPFLDAFFNYIEKYDQAFQKNVEGDSGEFFDRLINILARETKNSLKNNVALKRCLKYRCDACDYDHEYRKDFLMTIKPAWTGKSFKEECENPILEWDTPKVCPLCMNNSIDYITCEIKTLPKLLVIECPFNETNGSQNPADFSFPMRFQIHDFYKLKRGGHELEKRNKRNLFDREIFELYGIILYRKNDANRQGHYIVLVRDRQNPDVWNLADAERLIKNIDITPHMDFIKKYVRVLFYATVTRNA